MNILNYLLSCFILIFFLNVRGQTFNIKENVIQINTNNIFRPASKIEMVNSLKFKNEYYSIFEEKQMYDFGHTQKYLVKYDLSGKVLFAEKLPKELSSGYYLDFFVSDNNIYIQLQKNERYILDFKTNKFTKTTKGIDLVYDDSNYKVFYKDFGEWGQATWFINKKDKSEYFTSLNGQDINYFAGKFYVTNTSSIWEIQNPKDLSKCKPNQYYDQINKHEFGIFDSYNYTKGIKAIYKDSIKRDPSDFRESVDYLKYNFITSFVAHDHLYQITQLKDKTVISDINKNKVNIVYQFNEKYRFFSWYNQFRNTDNSYKFLRFKNGYNSFGFFETDHNNIDITKVHYKYDTVQYVKSDNIIQLISTLSDKSLISKKEVMEFEKVSNGIDIQQYRENINHNSYYPQKFKKTDIETIDFIKSENEYITQDIEYLFTKKEEQLKAIYIDWERTKFFNSVGKNYFPIRSENTLENDKKFKEKYSEIRAQLNKVGRQIHVKTRPDKLKYESWIFNGWRLNLYAISQKNINGITILICKQDDFNEDE
ncbi:hypothetical protein [Chryseobacterium vrystaatense]|uniref:Uncharacterized protein n=1 Tax=Chryseobacterium vrystaatense TaxID=307480 RepID=A0A1M5KF45_9FLAO|nr:hypothetical protein [Chryseobacterium vrystaatense]SHG51368.1 hypothetical protein SAMN02787073_4350 [Chryseobacterium vrystaatense]